MFDPNSNPISESQSLSEKTRVIFLSCPPVNEAKIRENRRFLNAYRLCILAVNQGYILILFLSFKTVNILVSWSEQMNYAGVIQKLV